MFRIREAFGVELRMAAFYEAPTLAACAAAIDAARPADRRRGRCAATGRRRRRASAAGTGAPIA